ncbi:MAG: F0F1 ATP synthase subunit B [Planctomycetes bacterium]|nr:F0F1 ATP synthase subunit B [Planctomycetota bacterium]
MRKIFVLLILVSLLAIGLVFAADEPVGNDALRGEAEVLHEEEGSPMGTPYEAFWTILSFLVLLIVLWRFAWKPLLAGLQAREDFIAKQISDAEDTRKKAEEVLSEYHDKLADADREGKGIIARHTKTAEKESKEIADLSKKELEELRTRLKAEIDYERKEAQSEFWDQAGDIVLQLGKEVLGKSMDHGDHDKLIDEAIVRLKEEETRQAKLNQE